MQTDTFCQKLLVETKNLDESKMAAVIARFRSEAIVEVQDLKLLEDQNFRDLGVPLGLVLRIKNKIRPLPHPYP